MSGRPATTSSIPGLYAICVGNAEMACPKGWAWTFLTNISRLETGHTPSRNHPEYWLNGDIHWIGIKDARLNHGQVIHETIQKVTQLGIDNSAARVLPAGTVCLSRTASVGYAFILGRQMATSQDFVNWVCSNALLPDFLMYALIAEGENIRRFGKGTTHTTIYFPEVKAFRICLAPLNEQRRIVAKIEELFSDLDAGVAALQRAKANLKRYRAAVLKAAVEGKLTEEWRARHPNTEPASKLLERILTERRKKWEADQLNKFAAAKKEPPKNWKEKYVEPTPPDTTNLPELPEGWCWAKLDQLLTYLRNGYFQSPSAAQSGTPILRINAVRPMKVDLTEIRYLNAVEGSVNEYFIEDGDLLFTRYNGSVDLLGVAGMVRGCIGRMIHPDKLIRVKLALGKPVPEFVELAANVGISRKHMAGRARTTAGQTGISGPDVREMPIALSPILEQSQIVREVAEKVSQIETAETEIEHGLIRAARLRQSILKQAFEGKLVPQDPNDEPANVLLDRIKASGSTGKQSDLKSKGGHTKSKRIAPKSLQ